MIFKQIYSSFVLGLSVLIVGGCQTPTNSSLLSSPINRIDVSSAQGTILKIKQDIEQEKKLTLQKGSESYLLEVTNRPVKGLVVMLHGFTAGTWQFEYLSKILYREGYHVYVPRLVGHGFIGPDGKGDSSQMLNSINWPEYHQTTEKLFATISGFLPNLHIVGLSGGATIALDLANDHPEIKTVSAMAPFIEPENIKARTVFKLSETIDFLTTGDKERWFQTKPFSWGQGCYDDIKRFGRAGHCDFHVGNVYGLTRYGRDVLRQSARNKVTCQFFTTAIDNATQFSPIEHIIHNNKRNNPYSGWVHYKKNDQVPHPMLHPYENKQTQLLNNMYEIVRKTIVLDRTTNY
jgi:pimeloyl-ACP methyl ester carboxylesterase